MPHLSSLAEARRQLAAVNDLLDKELDYLETLEPYTTGFANQVWLCEEISANRDACKEIVDWLVSRVTESG